MNIPSEGRLKKRSAAILFHNALDCDAIGALLALQKGIQVVGKAADFESFEAFCAKDTPDVVIVEACYPLSLGDVFVAMERLSRKHLFRLCLFVDNVPNRVRARRALELAGSGYILRRRSAHQFALALDELLGGSIPLDGFVSEWLHSVHKAHHHFLGSPFLAQLTPRQIEIMQLLAEGRTVSECAKLVGLAPSTVDNHKARIMKRLGVRKASQLTLTAVREGLIVP